MGRETLEAEGGLWEGQVKGKERRRKKGAHSNGENRTNGGKLTETKTSAEH